MSPPSARIPARALLLLFALGVTGCYVYPYQGFRHFRHRETYSMTGEELLDLSFYLSTDLLIEPRERGDAKEDEDPIQPVLIPAHSEGWITAIGPDWLRVTFDGDSPGFLFVSKKDPSALETREDDDEFYYLASEVPDTIGLARLADMESAVLRHEGWSYDVLYGRRAILMVESDAVDELHESRIP